MNDYSVIDWQKICYNLLAQKEYVPPTEGDFHEMLLELLGQYELTASQDREISAMEVEYNKLFKLYETTINIHKAYVCKSSAQENFTGNIFRKVGNDNELLF